MKRILIYILLAFFVGLQANAQNNVSYTYDANNQLTQVVYANGTTVKYTYDALGNRLSKKVTSVQQQYTLSLTASPSNGGRVTGGGTYYEGSTATINAIPNDGYNFSKWSDGNTNRQRSITVDKNISLTAYFVESQVVTHTLTLAVNPAGSGFVKGAGTYNEGETTTVSVTANAGYSFVEWSDGVKSSTRYVTMDKDYSLTAYMEKKTDTSNVFGDVNCDGVVDRDDYLYISDAYLGVPYDTSKCDLDGDGKLTVADVTIVAGIINGTYNNGGGSGSDDDNIETSKDIVFFAAPYFYSESKMEVAELIKGNTYKVYYKIQNVSSNLWEGNLYLLANKDTVKVWKDRDYDPEGRASINATYIPQSTGNVCFTLYCQPTGSNKSMLVAEGDYPSNPMYADVYEQASAQGSYRGYNYVNLGLPSGTLWASYNVGANKPEGYGIHYAWGETIGCDVKDEYQPRNYKYYDSSSGLFTKYYVEVDEETPHGIPDGLTQLLPEDDAATANWGGNWRMPTYKERDELMNTAYTTWTYTTINGIVGYKVESKVAGYEGNSIFLPIAGYCHGSKRDDKIGERGDYLTSSLYKSDPQYVCFFHLTPDNVSPGSTCRYFGISVRAVVSTSGIK